MKRTTLAVMLWAAPCMAAAQWHPLGQPMGTWQFGLDTSQSAGSCAGWVGGGYKAAVAGACRDLLLLSHRGQTAYHLGYAQLYGPTTTPLYTPRLGVNVGAAVKAELQAASERLPYLESLADWQAPAWLAYANRVASADVGLALAPRGRLFPFMGLKVDVPLADLKALLPTR